MKATKSLTALLLLILLCVSCKKEISNESIGDEQIASFLKTYPDFNNYGNDLRALYKKYQGNKIWYDQKTRSPLAEVLYDKADNIETEGIPVPLPYKQRFEKLFASDDNPETENDLLISAMYCFYSKKVFAGIDPAQSKRLGWYLPREKESYVSYLSELKKDNNLIHKDKDENIAMYYNLRKGLEKYRQMKNSGVTSDSANVSVDARIRTIIVNMERCRWLSPDITDAPEYIAVNIPSYKMRYVKEGKTALESDVVVGDEANRTVVFSGKMSYLVFSPYWNIPESIAEKEIEPGIAKDKNYLKKHNMEKVGKLYRQKPGKDNSLGLVKFMFPNANNIYLHDTPAKSLFGKDTRALSHGCVRVQKARELAGLILADDKNWTSEKIDEAMNAGKESKYGLNHKIPVYIAYFTALADENGNVRFFDDVYDRDAKLAELLFKKE